MKNPSKEITMNNGNKLLMIAASALLPMALLAGCARGSRWTASNR